MLVIVWWLFMSAVNAAVPRMIVVHHFDEELEWLCNINDVAPVTVVSRTLHVIPVNCPNVSLIHEPDSKGHEVNGYLRFILDYYDDLPDHTAFVHGHHASWHVDWQDQVLRFTEWNGSGYRPLQRIRRWRVKKPISQPHLAELNAYWNTLFQPYLGDYNIETTMYHCCGSFLVSADAIRRHPKSVYQYWHDWVKNTTASYSGYMFEYMWHRIFGRLNHDPDMS